MSRKRPVERPRYRVGGVLIESRTRLPGLKPVRDRGKAVRFLRLEPGRILGLPARPRKLPRDRWHVARRGRFVWLVWDRRIHARIDPRRRTVELALPPSMPDGAAAAILAGPALAVLSPAPGGVWHASAIGRKGRAVAFVGGPGSGKSTWAALCARAGARLVSDDALALREERGRILCAPGPAFLRLSRRIARLLAGTALESRSGWGGKDLLLAPRGGRPGRLPLAALVRPVGKRNGALRLERLAPSEAFRLAAACRFYDDPDPARRREMFRLSARLAATVPAFRLVYPRNGRPAGGARLLARLDRLMGRPGPR